MFQFSDLGFLVTVNFVVDLFDVGYDFPKHFEFLDLRFLKILNFLLIYLLGFLLLQV